MTVLYSQNLGKGTTVSYPDSGQNQTIDKIIECLNRV